MTGTEITLLDGGTGAELRVRGVHVRDYKSSLWSALANVEAPEAVIQLHRDYLDAGADIITVNNYAVTPVLLAREGLENDFEELTRTAAQCAIAARDTAHSQARVAGSLPPPQHDLRGQPGRRLRRQRRPVPAHRRRARPPRGPLSL